MTNVVKLKRGSGSDPSASDMVVGEPVIRTDTAELFFKKDDGTVAKVSGGGGGPDFKYLALRNSANNGAASYPAADFTLVTDGTTNAVTPAAAATLLVSYAGVIQRPSTGTSTPANGFALSGSTIKFAANIAAAPDFIVYQESGGIGEPSDNTVTTAKIVDDAVTADKLANSINSEIAANTAKVTNATHSGEVTGATALTIADNVVDEANLKVDNSPTNDYVLTAKSSAAGGLTWAAVSTTDSTKMPLAGGTFTGDVIWDSQTNAGRDMTWDESESDLTFNDAAYIQMGNSNDLTIGHNGTYSFITQTGSKLAIGSGGNHAVELLYGNAKKFETTSAGISVTGTITASSNINIGDSDEFIAGDSNDLRLWHNGTDSYIKNFTGDLYIQGDGDDIHMRAADDVNIYTQTSDKAVVCVGDGAVELYYDNSKKFETKSTGVEIHGHLITGDGNEIQIGNSGDLKLYHSGGDSTIINNTGILELRGNDIRLMNNAGNEHYVVGFANSYSALYYDNSKKIETTSSGVQVTGYVIASGNIYTDKILTNTTTNSATLYISGRDAAGNENNFIKAQCAGGVELNYNTYKKLETKSNGVRVSSSADTELEIKSTGQDGAPSILFVSDNADDNADNWRLRADGGGTAFSIQNFADAAWETNIECNESGNVELYYDNSKKFETRSDGTQTTGICYADRFHVNDSELISLGDSSDLTITHDGTHNVISCNTDKNLRIVNHLTGGNESMIVCDPNGVVELYYNGLKKLATDDNGIEVHDLDDSTSQVKLISSGGTVGSVYGNSNDSTFGLLNTAGEWIIQGVNNGATNLYYDNSKKLETDSFGVSIQGDCLKVPDGSAGSPGFTWNNEGNADTGIFRPGANQIAFSTASSERVRINASGHFLVGTTALATSDTDPGFGVDPDGAIVLRRNGTMVMLKSIGTGGYTAISILSANTEVGSCTFNSGGTAWNTSSDYRLKENQVSISDGITRLKTLKPYRFNFKTNPSETVDGFFAHEVSPAVPEAITGTKDAVATADDAAEHDHLSVGDPIYQQIDQSKLVPLLTAALQEAIGKIEVLETKVAALEAS